MCCLNILIDYNTNKGLFAENKKKFLFAVSSASYVNNNDGDGIAIPQSEVIKDFYKLDYDTVPQNYFNSHIILCHQRLATKGFNFVSLQPFKEDGFIFVHNGIFRGLGDTEKSDSLHFFEDFLTEFKKNAKDNIRENTIIKTLKSLLDNKNSFYSVAIYDELTNKLFYVKGDMTDIYFFKRGEFLFITTKEQNKELLSLLNDEKTQTYKIKDYRIYAVDTNTLKIEKTQKIKKEKFTISTLKTEINKERENESKDEKTQTTLKENYTNPSFIIGYDSVPCVHCGTLTYQIETLTNTHVCYNCSSRDKHIEEYF